MANILKIVFLGIIGFAGLVYLTAPENKINPEKKVSNENLNISSLPEYFEVVGNRTYSKKEEFITKGKESFLIVANHDSLVFLNNLYKVTKKDVLLVANISNTPWLMKKLAVDGKLEELFEKSTIRIINDNSGSVIKSLGLDDNTQTRYFIYKIFKDGKIKEVAKGDVKLDALQKGVSEEELSSTLNTIAEVINK